MCCRARASRSGPSCFTTLEADQGRRPPSDGSGPMVMGDAGSDSADGRPIAVAGRYPSSAVPVGESGTSAESYPGVMVGPGWNPARSSDEPSELLSGAKSPTTVVAPARNGRFESTLLQRGVRNDPGKHRCGNLLPYIARSLNDQSRPRTGSRMVRYLNPSSRKRRARPSANEPTLIEAQERINAGQRFQTANSLVSLFGTATFRSLT